MTFVANEALLEIKTVYYEPGVWETSRGKQILERFPKAELIPVDSHWKIEDLHRNEENIKSWNRIKKNVLVVGHSVQSKYCRPNCRSIDFIAPSHANGCAMACSYCYVVRRKG